MLLVHVEHPSARSTYVIRHVLERMLGIEVRWARGEAELRSAAGPRLSYSSAPVDDAVHVPWTGAIDALPSGDPPLMERAGRPVLFPTAHGQDLFAGIFFLLSLVDELRCTDRDVHGRAPSSALFTVRSGLAARPWVDEVVLELGGTLRERWPDLVMRPRHYRHVLTVDMDNVLRYAGRSTARAIGASAKDLVRNGLGPVVERWRVRWGARRDPFVQALEQVAAHRDQVDQARLFLLLRGDGPHDHAVPVERWPALLHQRFNDLARERIDIGLHPSYTTSVEPERMEQEVDTFTRHFGPLRATRQHYLRWRLPDTLRKVEALGIPEEHSLGFADRTGFRAATCTPFPWYDLERELETRLVLCPFHVMDSALVERMGCGPDEAVRRMNAVSDAVRAVNGTFVSVWHDRYLSGHRVFAPWPAVFEQVIRHARA